MPIVRYRSPDNGHPQLGWLEDDRIYPFPDSHTTLQHLLQHHLADISAMVGEVREDRANPVDVKAVAILAPIDTQEVWAAGVTYKRSRDARMEESAEVDAYDRIYDADRPEIFLKATARRIVGPDGTISIRSDSTWDVPEPELTLVINRYAEVVGYTIGNDVSSRSIEGENPLYLPQAKTYTGSGALGPVIVLHSEFGNIQDIPISLVIERNGKEAFQGTISTAEMHRSPDELVSWLHRGNTFPDGVFLMTGTGIVPPESFTLQPGDIVRITIDGIGTLTNPVAILDAGR